MKEKRFVYRKFLNPKRHGDAIVCFDGSVQTEGTGTSWADRLEWADLHITDCNRSINLDFDGSAPKRTRKKIQTLRAALDMADDWLDCVEKETERRKKHKKGKK